MNPIDRDQRSNLHYAARDGDAKSVRALIAQGFDVNLQDSTGWTPLHFAAQSQAASVVSLLLEGRARVDVEDVFGNTPLWRATFECKGDGTVIALLREAGADPTKKNKHGVSPVILAPQNWEL